MPRTSDATLFLAPAMMSVTGERHQELASVARLPEYDFMISAANDADLLKRLLSAPAGLSKFDDGRLLRELIKGAPKGLRGRRATTLFDALDVLNLENPHSDFIAWLLDPRGPLSANWLLRALLGRVAPEQPWPGDDAVVEREVVVEGGRLDIRISWDAFVLIIENKVWSGQGVNQVARYLPEIPTTADGRLIYLSPHGHAPAGVNDADRRVVAMSYVGLKSIVQEGIDAEPDERGRIFAKEFCRCIDRLLRIREDKMSKPTVSESTTIYLKETKRLSKIKSLAIEESSDFIQWMYSEIERCLRPILGAEMLTHRGRYVVMYRLPNWVIGKLHFGIIFSPEIDANKWLLTEAGDGPYVGAGCWRMDESESAEAWAECEEVSTRLLTELTKVWPQREDLHPGEAMPICREIPVPATGDLDSWSAEVIGLCKELAKTLGPALKRVAIAASK